MSERGRDARNALAAVSDANTRLAAASGRAFGTGGGTDPRGRPPEKEMRDAARSHESAMRRLGLPEGVRAMDDGSYTDASAGRAFHGRTADGPTDPVIRIERDKYGRAHSEAGAAIVTRSGAMAYMRNGRPRFDPDVGGYGVRRDGTTFSSEKELSRGMGEALAAAGATAVKRGREGDPALAHGDAAAGDADGPVPPDRRKDDAPRRVSGISSGNGGRRPGRIARAARGSGAEM